MYVLLYLIFIFNVCCLLKPEKALFSTGEMHWNLTYTHRFYCNKHDSPSKQMTWSTAVYLDYNFLSSDFWFRLFEKKPKFLLQSDKCTAGRSNHRSTPDDKAAADRKHLTRLVILGCSSEPAISTGSGICQIPSNLPHTDRQTDVGTWEQHVCEPSKPSCSDIQGDYGWVALKTHSLHSPKIKKDTPVVIRVCPAPSIAFLFYFKSSSECRLSFLSGVSPASLDISQDFQS